MRGLSEKIRPDPGTAEDLNERITLAREQSSCWIGRNPMVWTKRVSINTLGRKSVVQTVDCIYTKRSNDD